MFSINQLNCNTWDKTHVNESSDNKKENLWIRMMKNLKVKKLQSSVIPKSYIKKELTQAELEIQQ